MTDIEAVSFETMGWALEGADRQSSDEELKAQFADGDFDYLPHILTDPFDWLQRWGVVVDALPAESHMPKLPEELVSELAAKNLSTLVQERMYGWTRELQLFLPVRVAPGRTLHHPSGLDVPLRQAAVMTNDKIKGPLTEPNRRMLDIVYARLGVKADRAPEVETKTVEATQFQGPLGTPTTGQTQTHSRVRASLRGSYRVSNYTRRARLNKIAVAYDGIDEVETIVRIER